MDEVQKASKFKEDDDGSADNEQDGNLASLEILFSLELSFACAFFSCSCRRPVEASFFRAH